jgi:diguanylate cyclase (GGDEF)-like protein
MPQKKTLAPLLASIVAALYILSDVIISAITIITSDKNAADFLILFKELIPLLFLIIIPYFSIEVYSLSARWHKINRIFLLIAVLAVVTITAAGILYPETILNNQKINPQENFGTPRILDISPLMLIRNFLFIIFLIYTIVIILLNDIQKKSSFPVKKFLLSLFIVSYIAFYYLYIFLFSNNTNSVLYNSFPYMAFSITILMVFISFGIFELFINYNIQLANIKSKSSTDLYYDTKIGILNTSAFRRDLQVVLDKTRPANKNICLIFFDIDDFQNINESYGERVGDEILKMLTQRMNNNFKNSGELYRIGGDDFAFILADIKSEDGAKIFASKILTSLRNPFIFSGVSYMLTVSIAILLIPRDGDNLESIMNNAYRTIHSAKKNKNTFELFSMELLEGSSRKIHTVNLIRNSISKDEFVLFYHPIFNSSGKIEYAEALLRCTNGNPDIGGPGNFIPLIEKAGLIKEIDNFVVRNAFYDMEMKIKNQFGISINLSTSQIIDPDYGEFLYSFAKQHGIDPRRIILEITESAIVENIKLAQKSLAELKRNGFLIAIDDFGKGFSSLSYLAELPVDILKIDMSFVQAIPGEVKKELLAKYIMELGKSLNLKIVAEGFEKNEQVNFFKKLNCDLYQGFYFDRPMPIAEILSKYSADNKKQFKQEI